MQILAEIHPKSTAEKTSKLLTGLSAFDGFDFPDSPVGLPSIHPLAIAPMARLLLEDKRIIVNQRLVDVGELFLASLAKTAKFWGLELALTRGDPPKIGREVNSMSSEEGFGLIKSVSPEVKVGLLLSLRYPLSMLKKRLSGGGDFFLVLRVRGADELRELDKEKLIPYLIVKTERNNETVKLMNQPYVSIEELRDVLDSLRHSGVQGVLISTAGDSRGLEQIVKFI